MQESTPSQNEKTETKLSSSNVASLATSAKRMYGITIDDIYDKDLHAKLQKLPKEPRRTARIVVDNPIEDSISQLEKVVPLVATYCDVLLQVQDSFGEKNMSREEYVRKARILFTRFESICHLWEIGNEVNGDWCSPDIAERVREVLSYLPKNGKSILTLFCQTDIIKWYEENPIPTDFLFLSFYPASFALNNPKYTHIFKQNIETLVASLIKKNTKAYAGFGEFGFEEFGSPLSWRAKLKVRHAIENVAVAHPRWVGGGFYWDGQKEGF